MGRKWSYYQKKKLSNRLKALWKNEEYKAHRMSQLLSGRRFGPRVKKVVEEAGFVPMAGVAAAEARRMSKKEIVIVLLETLQCLVKELQKEE
jgi:hypothetical protein